ncbi:MAG TPA: pyrroloquinoline quinone biosynthesis protein PqqE [Gammaproteobacteria bacterium]|nr:pyrroloquinoline quinone biosynthesis protein PqqE [Gammaproteobacteria bacterium]
MPTSEPERDAGVPPPLWLLAELTYACPLQCPYCSNPTDFDRYRNELDTAIWTRVLREARALGACQLGLSGGEPLTRSDLETLVGTSRELGYYSNLITSGAGMDARRVNALRDAGLDHIQVSFQASERELNDLVAGTEVFSHKLEMARAVKAAGFPMVLCFVIHRGNIDRIGDMVSLAAGLGADYVELANTQYHGWAQVNRGVLMPTREQVERSEAEAHRLQDRYRDSMKILYVVPDYFERRPKACCNGWGSIFMNVAPDGTALPCHGAASLPGPAFPNVRDHSMADIWRDSEAFNRYRGFDWMKAPCRGCPEREQDFGGCRCQAYMLTGDPAAADPVCDKSPHHRQVLEAVAATAPEGAPPRPVVFRNPRNARRLRQADPERTV